MDLSLNCVNIAWLKIGAVIAGIIGITTFYAIRYSHTNKMPAGSVVEDNTILPGAPFIPEKLSFCGEEVPLNYFDVYESLEREIIVNVYWHSQTILFLKKAPRYFSDIEPILAANKIPDDFKYLVVAESGFLDIASPMGATGLWHFMEATAREYGLEVNDEVDERYNLEKSTVAACKYLNESYNHFKNWTLVAASYNGGRRGIDRQIERQGEQNYYNLLFGEETARYVFRILALKQVMENPEMYGFSVPKENLYKPIRYKEEKITGSIPDIGAFAKERDINYKFLKFLNPWLRDVKLTNSQKKEYLIKVPLASERMLDE